MFNKTEDAEERYAKTMKVMFLIVSPITAVHYGAYKTKKFVKEHKQETIAVAEMVAGAAALTFIGYEFKKLNDLEHAAPQS